MIGRAVLGEVARPATTAAGGRVPVALRWLIGILVLAAGVGKALDVPSFVAVVDTYRLLPPWALWPAGLAILLVEVGLGGWLLSGRWLRAAALASVLIHAGYAALMLVSLARGLRLANCGCFGVFLARPLTWTSPLEDAVLVVLSYILYRLAAPPDSTAERRRAGAVREGGSCP